MEIACGIYLIESVKGCNVYLLADESLILIDTGLPGNAGDILRFIRSVGRNPLDLSCIILTHGHIDHAGSLTELQARTGALGMAHHDEVRPAVDGEYNLYDSSPGGGVLLKALSCLKIYHPGCINKTVKDGDVLPVSGGLRIVHTPGHTPGSMSLLLEKQRILFVGDAIINNRDRLSRPLPMKSDRLLAEQSLVRLSSLEYETCCFGHGPPLQQQAQERIRHLALNRPTSPLYRRLFRNRRRLFHFFVRKGRVD
ncbi:MAG: MBL fold metallo-hydrolase [Dehalococcoidales bacterium]|nr:MBL fold metallo-hydrolase [Dehalococcoidales bacterium]